jgi:hypothetical protein
VAAHPFEMLMAGLGLLVCAALLVHMVIGERRRQQLDALRYRIAARWRQRFKARRSAALNEPLRANRPNPKQAAEQAQRAIDRARRGAVDADRVGNVIRPRAFKDKPDAPDRLH